MEKKPAGIAPASSAPVGVCEKLFNALQIHPTFTTIRRLTNRHSAAGGGQEHLPVPTAPPMATVHDRNPLTEPLLQNGGPPYPAVKAVPSRPNAPVLVPVRSTLVPEKLPGSASPPSPAPPTAPVEKGEKFPGRTESSLVKAASAAATPPQTAQPAQATTEDPKNTSQPAEKPKRNFNDKVEAYINRTRIRTRGPSHVGRTTTKAK